MSFACIYLPYKRCFKRCLADTKIRVHVDALCQPRELYCANENLMLTAGVGGRVTGGRYELAIGFGVVGGGGKYVLGCSSRTCGTGYWYPSCLGGKYLGCKYRISQIIKKILWSINFEFFFHYSLYCQRSLIEIVHISTSSLLIWFGNLET